MTETMWKIVDILRGLYLTRGKEGGYLASWSLSEMVEVDLEDCGINGDLAIDNLVSMGLIEELPELHCRYRIVVKEGE